MTRKLLSFRSQIVLLSRVAGIQAPVAGIHAAIDDLEGLEAGTLRSRRLGFAGKPVIHPKQVPVVHACFQPTAEELQWAKRVLEAAAGSGGAAIAMNGELVEHPIIAKARRILGDADRYSGKPG